MHLNEDENGQFHQNIDRCSIQFSQSDTLKPKSRIKKLLLGVEKIRDVSNQSIIDFKDNDRVNSAVVAGYNVTNLIQGIGILGVPYAVSRGSWVAIFLIFFTAVISSSTGKMIVDCLYNNKNLPGSRRLYNTYSSIGEAVWPKFGKALVSVISITEMFGGITLYIILMSVESQRLLSYFYENINIYYCCLVLTYSALPFLFFTRLSIISWFSFVAVVGLLSSIGVIIIFCFYNFSKLSMANFPDITWSSVPVSIGIIIFSYCAHSVFPKIEGSMKNPNSFDKMMNIAFSIAALVKFCMSFLFNLIYGSSVLQQCTLNVDILEFGMVIEILVIINTFFSIPLTMYVITERVDEIFQFHFHPSLWPGGSLNWYWLLLSRGFILTLSMFTAMVVPHFALLMGLIGSITGSCLTFIFPAIFSLKLKRSELSILQKVYRMFILIVGIIFGVLGTVVSLIEIVNTINVS